MRWTLASITTKSGSNLFESFPSTVGESTWADWAWLLLFLFLGMPLMHRVWKGRKKSWKDLVSLLVLVVFFFCGWSVVVYYTR